MTERRDDAATPPVVAGKWLERLGVPGRAAPVVEPAHGQSKAAVYRVQTADGPCVLKVTTSRSWRTAALRELGFYTELAPTSPVPVPELLASTVLDEGVCLLMSERGRSAGATSWTHSRWIRAAEQAGRLHRHGRAATAPGWVTRPSGSDPQDVTRAVSAWNRLGQAEIAEQLPALLADAAGALAQVPSALVHGDCHVGNLLLDGAEIVWVDWQEVGLGTGFEDLALLWQRAEFDGAGPPRSEMLLAYRRGFGTALDAAAEQQLLAAELRLLLVEWPHFLPYGDARQQQTILNRLQDARRAWRSWPRPPLTP